MVSRFVSGCDELGEMDSDTQRKIWKEWQRLNRDVRVSMEVMRKQELGTLGTRTPDHKITYNLCFPGKSQFVGEADGGSYLVWDIIK